MFARLVRFEARAHAALLEERNGSLEGDEVAHLSHVNSVAVGVADLGSARGDDDALGAEAVENAKDAFLQCRATHNAVVNHHEVVDTTFNGAVGNVVDMGHEIVA